LSKLQQQLKLFSGVDIALFFQSIQDGTQAKIARTKPWSEQFTWKSTIIFCPSRRSNWTYLCIDSTNISLRNKNASCAPNLDPETLAKAVQLQALQEWFFASTETRWIHKEGFDNNHNKWQLYNTLCTMRFSSWQVSKPDQPLFHTISPMETKGRYLMHYLPQYWIKKWAAIAQIMTHNPAGPATSSATTLPMDSPKPVNQYVLTVPNPQTKSIKLSGCSIQCPLDSAKHPLPNMCSSWATGPTIVWPIFPASTNYFDGSSSKAAFLKYCLGPMVIPNWYLPGTARSSHKCFTMKYRVSIYLFLIPSPSSSQSFSSFMKNKVMPDDIKP